MAARRSSWYSLFPGRTMSPRTTALRTAKGESSPLRENPKWFGAGTGPRGAVQTRTQCCGSRRLRDAARSWPTLDPKQAIASLSDLGISATRVLPLRARRKSPCPSHAPAFQILVVRHRSLGGACWGLVFELFLAPNHTYRTESRRLMPVPKASPDSGVPIFVSSLLNTSYDASQFQVDIRSSLESALSPSTASVRA